jgi:hypothetical protein
MLIKNKIFSCEAKKRLNSEISPLKYLILILKNKVILLTGGGRGEEEG